MADKDLEKIVLSRNLLLFDGVCNFCNAGVNFVLRRDKKKRLFFASLQSETGQKVLKHFGLPRHDFDTFVLVEKGKIYERSTAALRVAKLLGGFWSVFWFFMLVPRPLRNAVYGLIARHRYKLFGRRDACMIPTPQTRERFL